MANLDRREFLALAGLFGASLALPGRVAASRLAPTFSAAAFPQGVASADPHADGFVLWTRRPPVEGRRARRLRVEVARDAQFQSVVATTSARVSADSDWTCRVLVAGLEPAQTWWYRFIDEHGLCSRTGRSFTAPADEAAQDLRFAFVSCQNVNMGYNTAYRRMIEDDRARDPAEQLRFVLHLGDFIYEMVWYPEDRLNGQLQGRTLRDTVRLPHGEKLGDFHVPTDVDDYRAIYRAYLTDPDLQEARALWPFVCVWDNHEFSWRGWQSQVQFDTGRPAQTLRVAANQAWFEYIPARVAQPGRARDLERFVAPRVKNVPLNAFDDAGLSHEPNNLAAIRSLDIVRALRWGRHVELLLTDTRSFRAQPVFDREEAAPFQKSGLPWFVPQEIVHVLDGGRTYADGQPPERIAFGGGEVPNPRKDGTPPSLLGTAQKRWLIERLRNSPATWKLWGNSIGMLDRRTDLQHLPEPLRAAWPVDGYGMMSPDDWAGYPSERGEILDAAARAGVSNLVTLAGDRHAFFAGLLSPQLPPRAFEPVAAEFVVGSIGTPTLFEAAQQAIAPDKAYAPLYLHQAADAPARPAINVTLRHGVRSALALAAGDEAAAFAQRNAEVAPHLGFVDLDGHGYAVVGVTAAALNVEFVALPAPLAVDLTTPLYRVTHRVDAWQPRQRPTLRRTQASGEDTLAARFLSGVWA